MPKFELNKSIEARKLNPRTGIQTSDPPVTIPFGALIDDVKEDRDHRKFSYLGERYRCPADVLRLATAPVGGETDLPASAPQPGGPAPEESARPRRTVHWERLTSNWKDLMRLRVPGGWLVAQADANSSPSFYPDAKHHWL
ncbi:MAG: hypothetical protein ABSH46_08785 [Bryobacteraceae bacterium]|jgi:hypothetical protein